jgi:hypothetical protein
MMADHMTSSQERIAKSLAADQPAGRNLGERFYAAECRANPC